MAQGHISLSKEDWTKASKEDIKRSREVQNSRTKEAQKNQRRNPRKGQSASALVVHRTVNNNMSGAHRTVRWDTEQSA
jgi:NAD dependent epimerase/dehydratase family enzyme